MIVRILRVGSELMDVRFEGVEFRWNYLIITYGKANNSKTGMRALIDMYIFSKYYIFSLISFIPCFVYLFWNICILCLVNLICWFSCICLTLLLCFNPIIVTFSTFPSASIGYRLLCGQGLIMACMQSVFNELELEKLHLFFKFKMNVLFQEPVSFW